MKTLIAAALVALALISSAAAGEPKLGDGSLVRAIDRARIETNELRRSAGLPVIRTEFLYRRSPSLAFRKWTLDLWRDRVDVERDRADERRRLAAASAIPWPWNALADCETGDSDGRPPYRADWTYNGSSGFDGGIQFDPGTWRSAAYVYSGDGDAFLRHYPYAYTAPARVQVDVGRAWLAVTSWRQWPACSAKIGLR